MHTTSWSTFYTDNQQAIVNNALLAVKWSISNAKKKNNNTRVNIITGTK